MRFIQTFVVHLYVDTEAPEQLCGNLRPLNEKGLVPFKSPLELEELLRRLIGKPSVPITDPPCPDPCPDG